MDTVINTYLNENIFNEDQVINSEEYSYRNQQIKSKERVNNHGEVLTPEWLVNDMLNLLPISVTNIESRYLETSAGEGAFLVEILRRKLDIVFKRFQHKEDIEFYTIVAISNIYGLELLLDNIKVMRIRLETVIKEYFFNRKLKASNDFWNVIRIIIEANTINMDSLKCKTPLFNENNEICMDTQENIIFKEELPCISEWEIDYKLREIKRVEYVYADVVNEQRQLYCLKQKKELLKQRKLDNNVIDNRNVEHKKIQQISLFDLNSSCDILNFDNRDEEDTIVRAKPIKIYEKVYYLNLINELKERGC